MPPIRVLLVDDNPVFLRAAERLVASEDGLEVVGTAHDGREAVAEVERLRPELVLMDLRMAGMSGIEATRIIKRVPHPPRVVIMTVEDPAVHAPLVDAAGADGFVAKTDFTTQMRSTVGRIFPAATPL